jgi:hypothetical protein
MVASGIGKFVAIVLRNKKILLQERYIWQEQIHIPVIKMHSARYYPRTSSPKFGGAFFVRICYNKS